jgi:hypothetical protein
MYGYHAPARGALAAWRRLVCGTGATVKAKVTVPSASG